MELDNNNTGYGLFVHIGDGVGSFKHRCSHVARARGAFVSGGGWVAPDKFDKFRSPIKFAQIEDWGTGNTQKTSQERSFWIGGLHQCGCAASTAASVPCWDPPPITAAKRVFLIWKSLRCLEKDKSKIFIANCFAWLGSRASARGVWLLGHRCCG